MLKTIILNAGARDGATPLRFSPGAVTIFVGPNNSGKSLLLREIELFCQGSGANPQSVLNQIEISDSVISSVGESLQSMSIPRQEGQNIPPGHFSFARFNSTRGYLTNIASVETLSQYFNTPNQLSYFCGSYLHLFASRLGGKDRFNLTKPQPFHSLQNPPQNVLNRLFRDNEKREFVRAMIFDAFKKHFVIDPTNPGNLQIRMSGRAPADEAEEKGWTERSVAFHRAAGSINSMSDGVQAYTGIVMTVLAGEEKIFLIDEPEAFLHPSLAYTLGKKLSEIMAGREGNLCVSTHSANFLMGCIESGKALNIVRLTYENFAPTARALDAKEVSALFKKPILRSSNIVEALFHSAVIVGESDVDRTFYSEINRRLVDVGKGIPQAQFLNAHSKQSVREIVGPLRRMGIPSVGIVDIDFINEGGTDFTKALEAIRVPVELHSSFHEMRRKLKEAFDRTNKKAKVCGGLTLLNGGELAQGQKLLKDLAEYGLFVVPIGEVESWLKNLGCNGHGPMWLSQMFEKLGSEETDSSFVRPNNNDVWHFIEEINKWVTNSNRKGTD